MNEEDWRQVYKGKKARAQHILHEEKFTDCSFLVGQRALQIRGHKLILASTSPVFERMFYGSFDDAKSNEIRIPDIRHRIFLMMMEYIYFEKLQLNTTPQAIQLYSAAHKYMLQELMGKCIDFLKGQALINRPLRVYEFAVFFEENNLITKSADYIASNTSFLLKQPAFLDVNLTTIISLFERDNIKINSELELFQALKKYALANGYFETKNSAEDEEVESEIGRRKLLRKALTKIRFLCMKPEQFEIVAKSGLLTESEVSSISLNINNPNITDCPMPEGFSNSRAPRRLGEF